MRALPVFVDVRGKPVIVLGEGQAASEKAAIVQRARGIVTTDEAAAARIAIVAHDSEDETRAAVERLRARGLLVNAVDRPALCDFTMPAIVDRDPVTVAIGTAGASAGLSGVLRERLDRILPANLGAFAEQLEAMKFDLRARFPDHKERRAAIAAMLDEAFPDTF